MAEIGKLLQNDLKDIEKKYPHASGKQKARPKYFIWIILPFVVFFIWDWIVINSSPGRTSVNLEQTKQINQISEIVQATNQRMTEVSVMDDLVKQLTPENILKAEVTDAPVYTPTRQVESITNYDPLQTGLDANEVMSVLQNLPYPGRFRTDSQNEMAVYAKDFKISFYFPPYGGINCDARYHCSFTASGKRVMEGVGYYVACPPSLPFGTKLIIFNKEWICEDRGSAITEEWLDLLYPYMPYGLFWSQSVTVKVIGKVNDYATVTLTPEYQYPTITKTNDPEIYPTITKTTYPTITKTMLPEPTGTPTLTGTMEPTPTGTHTAIYTVSPTSEN